MARPKKKDTEIKKVKVEKIEKKEEKVEKVEKMEKVAESKEEPKEVTPKKTKPLDYKGLFHGTGRRKTAVARVFLWDDKGEITVNNIPATEYFRDEIEQNAWIRPFHLVGVSHPKARFKGSILVRGSSRQSQMGAIVHGISRALATVDAEFKVILAKAGMLTRDSRMVERKKPFLHKARKRPQYSKR